MSVVEGVKRTSASPCSICHGLSGNHWVVAKSTLRDFKEGMARNCISCALIYNTVSSAARYSVQTSEYEILVEVSAVPTRHENSRGLRVYVWKMLSPLALQQRFYPLASLKHLFADELYSPLGESSSLYVLIVETDILELKTRLVPSRMYLQHRISTLNLYLRRPSTKYVTGLSAASMTIHFALLIT
jgi:hypothetical protein